ncbi:MAG TPA: hypothetical protein VEX37_08625 [Thermomicrobiales bacterium]|nr:hypothetical protein [Thermomicrobiales bacterium]
MNRFPGPQRLVLATGLLQVWSSPLFFRRDRSRPARADAYRDLFATLATLYESAARLRPDWRDRWRDRRDHELPPKYEFGDEIARDAAYDVRYATALLQRYRWKSVVQPLFDEIDDQAWSRFAATASEMSPTLLALTDRNVGLLREDEADWINTAVEQFDEASRRRRRSSASETPRAQQITEGTYQPIYIAIQLSERLIERLRFEASQR